MKTIHLSGDIGWEVTPDAVREQLAAAAGDDIELVISSRGGLVGAALEIFNLIRNYPGTTTARLSGYAMSAASYIPMAADRVIVEDNAVMMIHNCRGVAIGDHNEVLKFGNILRGLSSLLAGAYAKFTGKDKKEVAALLDAETWMYGEEIVAAGFAHEVVAAEGDDEEGMDRAAAIAAAGLELSAVHSKMAAAQAAVQSDLNRAAAMAPGGIGNRGRTPKPPTKEPIMDLNKLKAEFPELVAAITDEATASIPAQLEAAMAAGAEAERARIAAVRAQLIPGHEGLIEALAADGRSSGADAAMAIIAAEKELRASQASRLTSEGNAPVASPAAIDATTGTMKRSQFDALSPEAQRAHLASGGKIVE